MMTYKPSILGQSDLVFDHARRGMVYNFSHVCLYVCLSVRRQLSKDLM